MEWSLAVWEYEILEWSLTMFDGMEYGILKYGSMKNFCFYGTMFMERKYERMTESNYLCTRNARLCVWNLRRQSNSTD